MTSKMTTHLQPYKTGDSDTRPWGGYVVTRVGTTDDGVEYCEKTLTVQPNNVFSLQSHAHRRERWQVLDGTPTIILNGETLTLKKGDDVDIPPGVLHAMGNLSGAPVIVHERQEGLCREEDITRYLDAYGRAGPYAPDALTEKSVAAFKELLKKIQA